METSVSFHAETGVTIGYRMEFKGASDSEWEQCCWSVGDGGYASHLGDEVAARTQFAAVTWPFAKRLIKEVRTVDAEVIG